MQIDGLEMLYDRTGPPEGTGPMTGRQMGYRDAGVQGLDLVAPEVGGLSAARLRQMWNDLQARVLSARQAYLELKSAGYTKIPAWLTGPARMARHIAQEYYRRTGTRLGTAAAATGKLEPAIQAIAAAVRPAAKPTPAAPTLPAVTPAAPEAPAPPYAAIGIGAALVAAAAWFMWGRK